MNKHSSEFKKRFKELMETMKIRQTDVAQRTGISESNISKYISGQQTPKSDKIDLIASTYGVNPAWLLGYDVPMFEKDLDRHVPTEIDYTTSFGTIEAHPASKTTGQQLQHLLSYASALLNLKENDRKIVEDMIDRLSGGETNDK